MKHAQTAADAILPLGSARFGWLFSLPLLVGLGVYARCLYLGKALLNDGDTYWHIAAGQWILQHGAVPSKDPFSHTMQGAQWTAHEWLSEVLLAAVHQAGGWVAVVAFTALMFSLTTMLLTRALLRNLEPIYAFLFAALAVVMTVPHLLARPHILAMPFMMIWVIELVRASDTERAPPFWLLPVMTVWANMHGGFTLGLALAGAFAVEALLAARQHHRLAATAKAWGIFLVLAVGSSLLTPHGAQGILFTWEILFEGSYALERISEWKSPDFHQLQPLELWLLGALTLAMHQGLRLPPIRLMLLVALTHLSLKHIRNVELLGLLAPVILASPLAAQWRRVQATKQQFDAADRFFRKLAEPAGQGAVLLSILFVAAMPLLVTTAAPLEPPEHIAPKLAVRAVLKAGVDGPVLNGYDWGGYLIYAGIPPFIDGRADMYRESFLKEYAQAMELRTSDGLEKLLSKYKIAWTLLPSQSAPAVLLDHLPGWQRLYADEIAVVHVRAGADRATTSQMAHSP